MTARFLLHLRVWDDRICNPETDELRAHRGRSTGPMRFKKSEPHATQWTINNMLGDDPLLRPLGSEVHCAGEPSGGSSMVHPEP